MSSYRLTKSAETDLLEIWLSIAQDDLAAADRVAGSLTEAFGLLATQPKMGRARPELSSKLRSFPKDRYIIFYRLAPDALEIVRVLHSSRDTEHIVGDL
jgi:toxin ParE1/3/4